MKVYIKELNKCRDLYLYNPKDNEEITEMFFSRIFEDDTMLLSDEEKNNYHTDAKYIMTSSAYNAWCVCLDKQQVILDKADTLNVSDDMFNKLLNIMEL